MAQGDATTSVKTTDVEPELRSELKTLEPYLGTWVLDSRLKDGRPFWAKSQYAVGMDGNYVVEKLFTKNDGEKVQLRQQTIWRWDTESGSLVSHVFKHDGTYEELKPVVETSADGKPAITTISVPPGSPVSIQQTIQIIDKTSYQWSVSSSATKNNPIMEGVWIKQKKE